MLFLSSLLALSIAAHCPDDTIPSRFANEECSYQLSDTILSIPAGTKQIPPFAFAHLDNIRVVEFQSAESLREIGEYAFWQCSSLHSIILPESLVSLGDGAFQECSNLKSISIPGSVKTIPVYCFAWCENLQHVSAPGVTDISRLAFSYCSSLENFSFSKNLYHIGPCAFTHCTSLSELFLGDKLKEIESYAFSECKTLKTVRMPANNHLLGELIFSGCRALTSITEPSAIPPKFDCNSFFFEPDESIPDSCTLIVPRRALSSYVSTSPWCRFSQITPLP